MNKILFSIVLLASLFSPSYASKNSDKEIISNVEKIYSVISQFWREDKVLSKKRPPQLIILNRGSKVFGGCMDRNKKDNYVVAGSEFCGATNTILLDKEQLRGFYEVYKAPGVLFLAAHEAAHAVQLGYLYSLKEPFHELQADCIASRLMTFFAPDMTENELKKFSKVAINSGSEIHGTGLNRTDAIKMGLGLIKGECMPKELYDLITEEKKY